MSFTLLLRLVSNSWSPMILLPQPGAEVVYCYVIFIYIWVLLDLVIFLSEKCMWRGEEVGLL